MAGSLFRNALLPSLSLSYHRNVKQWEIIVRKIFRHIAIRIYNNKYTLLRDRILEEYELIKYDNAHSLNTISKILISGEDHRFYYHIGFDIIALIRAIVKRIFYNKIEGASTIEQQLVRVLINDFEKTFCRKIKEIFLATTIASIVPRNAIPKIYLNVAYYGTGMNGLSKAYLKLGIIDWETISIEQAAEIVSMIKYPLPAKPSLKRLEQIKTRKEYLIKLYKKHLSRKYFKIY
jgi:membrane peptidoglycan carboxypeptidase